MVSMGDLQSEMDMSSPPHSPHAAMSGVTNMQEMDMEQDDDDTAPPTVHFAPQPPPSIRGAPPAPPTMIPRVSLGQHQMPPPLPTILPGVPNLPPVIPSDRLPAPLKPQDVIIKTYNPKGKSIGVMHFYQAIMTIICREITNYQSG